MTSPHALVHLAFLQGCRLGVGLPQATRAVQLLPLGLDTRNRDVHLLLGHWALRLWPHTWVQRNSRTMGSGIGQPHRTQPQVEALAMQLGRRLQPVGLRAHRTLAAHCSQLARRMRLSECLVLGVDCSQGPTCRSWAAALRRLPAESHRTLLSHTLAARCNRAAHHMWPASHTLARPRCTTGLHRKRCAAAAEAPVAAASAQRCW
mmetsp:Transcript_61928/g.144130  ORF Transcript_61928/g.144130 Transcript_61928/m.144130 type:complete len:205 (-) Transcript_61928:527-1141(-)